MDKTDTLILSYDSSDRTAKLVRIGPFANVLDAHFAVTLLENAGIHAVVSGENLATTLGPIYGAAYAGGPYVLVADDAEATAREIVADVERLRRERAAGESPACPACENRPTDRVLHRTRWIALGLLLVAFVGISLSPWALVFFAVGVVLLMWPTPPAWWCPTCGHSFTAPVPTVVDDGEESSESTA